MKKTIMALICALLVSALLFSACGKTAEPAGKETESAGKETEPAGEAAEHAKILFTMESGDTFTIELYPEYAPETCENFEKLVREGFYDGLTFHRVIDDFMAQGGDAALSDLDKKKPATIKGEFASNGFTKNTLSHTRGVVSMARVSGMPDSASSQFFICYTDCSFLDGDYAAFGKVVDGMETVDDFLKVERSYSGRELSSPNTPIVIKTAEVIE